MTEVWSGGLAFMYFEEDNGYGVVKLDPETNTVAELPDFYLLQEQYQAAEAPQELQERTMRTRTCY